jgi:hypothetical protein
MPPRGISRRLQELRDLSAVKLHCTCDGRVRYAPTAPHRDRIYGPTRTFWLFLWQVLTGNGSCSAAVLGLLAGLASEGAGRASQNTAAYCKARGRLENPALGETMRAVAEDLGKRCEDDDLCHGRPRKLLDGTSHSMPDTPQNQERFPQSRSQKPGCGFPVARVVVVFSMLTGAVLRAAWDSLRVSERTLFHRLWDVFEKDDIVVADRGFCSFADFWMLRERGVDSIMRKHQGRTVGERTLRKLGKNDRLVVWFRSRVRPKWLDEETWKTMPSELIVREIEVNVEIPGFRTHHLLIVTTLLDDSLYPTATFAEIYRRRWLVELFLRDIKTQMGMEVLKCKTPEMIEKELRMFLIAYNLVRSLMLQAAQTHGCAILRISFKRTIDALREWIPHIHGARRRRKEVDRLTHELLYYIARLRVPDRPGRTEPRAVKRRSKPYQLLQKPRHEFREAPHRNKWKPGQKAEHKEP